MTHQVNYNLAQHCEDSYPGILHFRSTTPGEPFSSKVANLEIDKVGSFRILHFQTGWSVS